VTHTGQAAGRAGVAGGGGPEAGEALGPGCLLWRYAGDWRSMLPGLSAGVLQLMHPAISAGVEQHSAFFDDPFERVRRSVPQIWATIFAPDGGRRGRALRGVHRAIKGVDHRGRPYHALDPETFWWAHATFTWEVFRSVELFHTRQLSAAEAERLYAQTVTWYRRYGVSCRPVPADYAAFRDRFDAVCNEELELTPAVTRALELNRRDVVGSPLGLPEPLASVVAPLAVPATELVALGCLPDSIRARLPFEWGTQEQLQFRGICAAVRQLFRLVPPPFNRRSLRQLQRLVGARTRPQRYRPAA
jgi:uncharacterized protein (DUF2236 family)